MRTIRHSAVLVALLALALVPVAATGAAGVVKSRPTPPIGRQLAELKGSDTRSGDYFGSVAISGKTAIVGATGYAKNAGRAYLFTRTANGWKQVAELKGSDTRSGDYFGSSVAVSGTTVVVEAAYGNFTGQAYVFTKAHPAGDRRLN